MYTYVVGRAMSIQMMVRQVGLPYSQRKAQIEMKLRCPSGHSEKNKQIDQMKSHQNQFKQHNSNGIHNLMQLNTQKGPCKNWSIPVLVRSSKRAKPPVTSSRVNRFWNRFFLRFGCDSVAIQQRSEGPTAKRLFYNASDANQLPLPSITWVPRVARTIGTYNALRNHHILQPFAKNLVAIWSPFESRDNAI